eukprot:21240_1
MAKDSDAEKSPNNFEENPHDEIDTVQAEARSTLARKDTKKMTNAQSNTVDSNDKTSTSLAVFTQAINSLPLPTPPSAIQVSDNNSPRSSQKSPEGLTLNLVSSAKGQFPGHGGISPSRVGALKNLSLPITSPDPGGPSNILPSEADLDIEDGTPAALALRANADVKVTKLNKVARALHANAVKKLVKKSVGAGMGEKRGKPPRLSIAGAEEPDNIDELQKLPDVGHLDILEESDEEGIEDEDEDVKEVE